MGLVISEGLRLKSYNTPAAIAGVAPTLDYRFALDRREIEAISLTDKLTYTGATNGTFVNRSGLIERATTDLPRFDHNPASRQSLGLLVEESRANLLLRSEEFQTTWDTSNLTVSTDTAETTAPNGTVTAEKITGDSSASNIKRISQSVTLSAIPYAFSVYAKASDQNFLQMRTFGPFGTIYANFDIATGVVGTTLGVTSASITAAGSGWYRCQIVFTPTATTSSLSINFITTLTSPSPQNTTLTTSFYLWGAQAEAGASPTSYIPTTTTTLTRPVDSAVIDGTGVITGTYTLVEKPAGCAVVNGSNIDLVSGFTAERVMVFPAALSAPQITAIRGAM